VPHHNSVFHAMLKHLPWDELDAAVVRHDAAGCARGFSFKSQVVALVYAQVSGADSLRHVVDGLRSHADRLPHLGAVPCARSTLADANRDRPAEVFSDLLGAMIKRLHRGLRRRLDGLTHLIDSTSLMLNARSANWAHVSAHACGAKLHVVYDPDADCPVYTAVTPARVPDITAAHAMPVTKGATYVFDLGYYDYAWWAKLDAAGCRIVTRLKANTPLRVTEARPVPSRVPGHGPGHGPGNAPSGPILSDRIGQLPTRKGKGQPNPMTKPVREVRVRIDTGPVLRILTNDLDAPAQEIADLYKRCWAVELFFRWVKQTLQITRFLGTTENAVRIQIACALIAFLLLCLAQATLAAITSPLAFARLVRDNLMHRRDLADLSKPPPRTTQARTAHEAGQGVLIGI